MVVARLGFVAWALFDWSREMTPETYLHWLDTNPSVYAGVDSVPESELDKFAYAYDENQFADAIPKATRRPRIANSQGHVPAFKLGDDVFVLTWKWVNSSAGLAISESPDFQKRIESLDYRFRVRRLAENIYAWNLDLEAPHP